MAPPHVILEKSEEGQPMSMIGFPLLLIPLAIANIAVLLMKLELEGLQKPIGFAIPLLANNTWEPTYSDALLSLGLIMLLFEVVKSARPGAKYFTDHLLSLLVFAGAAAEFLLLPKFAHSTFFLLTLMALIDVIAGIAIRSVRPKVATARVAPAPAAEERPPARPAAAPAPVEPPPAAETPAGKPQDAVRLTEDQHEVPIAPNQEVLPPEPRR
jgi:hypothetical protein